MLAPAASQAASRITNGTGLFADDAVDMRTRTGRRYRDLVASIASDLGGLAELSQAQVQLIRRAALLSLTCEEMEAKAVAGETIDVDLFGVLTDRLGRCLGRLGLKRVPKDITPDLATYLRNKAAAEAEAA